MTAGTAHALVLQECIAPPRLRTFGLPPARDGGRLVACGFSGVSGTAMRLR